MTYDPRMLQMPRMGIGMMGPQASPFDRANQPLRWWDQPPPQPQRRPDDSADPQPANQPGQSANSPANSPNASQPSLLQMLMLGGPASYSGAPKPGANPWAWLGGMGMPGGAGWGGSGVK